jgi:hypothetical protein
MLSGCRYFQENAAMSAIKAHKSPTSVIQAGKKQIVVNNNNTNNFTRSWLWKKV